MTASVTADATIPELLASLESQQHQRIREDLFELASLFARVCANNTDAGLRAMRTAFGRLGAKLLLHIEREQIRPTVGDLLSEGESIAADLADLRCRRVSLDDDLSEARLRLDAGLVLLDRHVTQAIDLEHAVFERAVANEDDAAGPQDRTPARKGGSI